MKIKALLLMAVLLCGGCAGAATAQLQDGSVCEAVKIKPSWDQSDNFVECWDVTGDRFEPKFASDNFSVAAGYSAVLVLILSTVFPFVL
jgi:hypothetical protein